MNQIITDNRHKIDTACQLCFHALEKYNKAVDGFNNQRQQITASPYIQQEKERRINQEEEKLVRSVAGYYEEIRHNLDVIRDAAVEMEDLLDIGQEFQNALSVVKTLGKAMPSETRISLVEGFKGQRQALIILKAAFEDVGISSEPYFKGLILNASKEVDALDEMAYRLNSQPGKNVLVAVSFASSLEKFAEALGVKLAKRFADLVDTTGAVNQRMRAVMGLSND